MNVHFKNQNRWTLKTKATESNKDGVKLIAKLIVRILPIIKCVYGWWQSTRAQVGIETKSVSYTTETEIEKLPNRALLKTIDNL